LEFGASTLLKIGYRQDIKKFGVKLTAEEASIAKARENQVKASFRDQLGLIVDQRRDGGAGNTTTGNVARIALAHPGNFYRHSYLQLFKCTCSTCNQFYTNPYPTPNKYEINFLTLVH
jgi:hypothetical protein